MPARNHHGNGLGGQAHDAVVAKAVAQQQGIVLALLHLIDGGLQARPHLFAPNVVQALGEKIEVDDVRRARHAGAKLAEEDFATDKF